ncbi:uncharacterized protein LOC135951723 [Calliphora vicina]|uniref:uncharacterized protein LOC135951723 n=1 Tax=Calliphora vicina TaxID=7373 RepID=UPI00325A8518
MLYRKFTIFVVLSLIQATYCKPVDDDTYNRIVGFAPEDMSNLTPIKKIIVYVAVNYLRLAHEYTIKSFNVSQRILMNQDLLTNQTPQVLEFKHNLTRFVEDYEKTKTIPEVVKLMNTFPDTTEHYFQLPEEKRTAADTFILDLLKKYNCMDVDMEYAIGFNPFIEKFKLMFEENKKYFEKPVLDWYEKFLAIDDLEEKLKAFMQMMEENNRI